ncbi:putative quinol monooxygenase [Streptomyces sp. NPDC058690]|uniref:putative quinol monooxygenase n=1 Tax=Streptomyces sp. NPDC058690 TaxID=3346600 RepID=UPI00366126BA
MADEGADCTAEGRSDPMSEPAEIDWPLNDARPGQVVVVARWNPGPGSRDIVRAELANLVTASRREPGCLGYQVFHPDGAMDGDIVLIERYADREAHDAHRDSPHFQRHALKRIVPLLRDRQVVVTTVA